jgi:hypothetical protein
VLEVNIFLVYIRMERDILTKMKLTFREQQPIRLWFLYLQTCLRDEVLSKKVNRNFYKDWHLNSVKTQKFNTWIKSHQHLFTKEFESKIKLYQGKRTPNSILIEIPLDYTVQKIQRDIGKVVKGKIAQKQTNQRFQITAKTNLKIAPFDYFLYAWQIKRRNDLKKKKMKLKDIWEIVDRHIRKRQSRIKPWLKDRDVIDQKTGRKKYIKGKIGRRMLSRSHEDKSAWNTKTIVISKNIKKAQTLLENVCKGVFPGDYSV